MARFRYRMQNILEIKLKLEEQAKMEFASANFKLNEEREKLDALIDRRQQYENHAKKLVEDILSIRKIQDVQKAVELMKTRIKEQILEVRIAEKKAESARRALQLMMQDRKTHEKLKEKAFDQFLMDENARESKEIDELTSYTHGKRSDGR